MSRRDFETSLEDGVRGERFVSEILKGRGWGVISPSDLNGDKAPRLYFARSAHVTPDQDVFRDGRRCWVEVKTYGYPAVNATRNCKVHGIKLRHRNDYRAVEHQSGAPVWLAIVEKSDAKGDPQSWPPRRVLMQRLADIEWFACQCRECRGVELNPECLVYFQRDLMSKLWGVVP